MIRTRLEVPIPPGENPFAFDDARMGTSVDNNITILYERHADNDYIIVHDKRTGERVRLDFRR